MCIPLSSFQNPYEVGNLYKSLSINPKMNICKFELFCPACSQFFFNCKNRWLSLFIVHARGRDVKSQGEEETKGEWRGEMDRGEDRDLLSSAVFDGSHDRLHNKRLMANDSKRKRDGKRWRRGREGGGVHFHSGAFSRTGVMFGRDHKTTRLSVIWSPRHTIPPTGITVRDLKK